MVACLVGFGNVGWDSSPTERGYFDDFILKLERSQSETATYEKAVAEESLDLNGRGVRTYVEVLGGSPQEQVADASTYQVSDEPARMESVERAQRIRAHLLS